MRAPARRLLLAAFCIFAPAGLAFAEEPSGEPEVVTAKPVEQQGERWRYKLMGTQWWYWQPSNRWVVWNGSEWIRPEKLYEAAADDPSAIDARVLSVLGEERIAAYRGIPSSGGGMFIGPGRLMSQPAWGAPSGIMYSPALGRGAWFGPGNPISGRPGPGYRGPIGGRTGRW